MAPTFAIYFKFIYHETDNENNKKTASFYGLLSTLSLSTESYRGGSRGERVAHPPELTFGFLIQL